MELAIVLVIALVIFGPKRLPELGQSLGKGMREFKESISGSGDDDGPSEELKKELTAQSPATTADPPDEAEEEKARAEVEAEVVTDDRA
jgi:sec-independent protein translocase protein TatA